MSYHCLLLRYIESAHDFDVWEILDLESDKAGGITRGYLFENDRGNGSRWEMVK